MWPIFLLFNKILKTEDERELKGDNLSVIDPYLFQQSSSNIDSHPPSLCCPPFVDVPHVNQIYTWDCGLACLSMVLKTIGVNNCNIQALAELCCTTSIWTVDLAYLLQRFSVTFSYFTVTFGANPNYCVESFYKEELPNDLVRVDMLFQKAVEAGIDIQCRSITGEDISVLILSGKYIAIALVDQNKLSYVWQDVHVPGVISKNPGYTGHYVLICGYDAGADMFEIRDPASSRKHQRISSKSLEEARKAFGTDEDLLLVCMIIVITFPSHRRQDCFRWWRLDDRREKCEFGQNGDRFCRGKWNSLSQKPSKREFPTHRVFPAEQRDMFSITGLH